MRVLAVNSPTNFFSKVVFAIVLVASPIVWAMGASAPQVLDKPPALEPDAMMKLQELMDDPSSFIGIEILEAEGTKELESSFGHSLLRLVDNDGDSFNDVVFNFYPVMENEAGEPEEGGTSIKAFVDYFQLGVEMNTLNVMALRYAQYWNRELYRLPILSTPENRRLLLLDLEKLINDPELRGHYTAMTNNCIGVILKAFQRSGFPSAGAKTFLPQDVKKYFRKVGLAPYNETTIIKADAQLAKAQKNIDKAQKLAEQGRLEEATKVLTLENAWRALVLKERNEIPDAFYLLIIQKTFEAENTKTIRDSVFGLSPLDSILYSICNSKDCAQKQMKLLSSKMSINYPKAKNQKEMVKIMRGDFFDEKPMLRTRSSGRSHNLQKKVASKFVEWVGLRDAIELHYDLLYKAAR